MDLNESRSLDFKQRIKQSFALHHLNPSNTEEQSEAPKTLNPSEIKESEDGELNAIKTDEDEDIEKIVSANAEDLGKSFKKCKNKKNKYSNLAESNRIAPNWNMSIKKVLSPISDPESILKYPEEVFDPESALKTPESIDKQPYLLDEELLESAETNPWTFHRLSKDDSQTSGTLEEVSSQSSYRNRKKTHYTKEEKEVLKILRSATTFKPLKKPNLNDFDGAGVNCFKDREIKSSTRNEKPKNVPPPGGYVCIKPLTIEDIMKRPPNLIIDECWDYDDEEW